VCRCFAHRMYRNALCDPQIPPMQKHKFGVMCLDSLFVEAVPGPPKYEKLCVDVSHPRDTGMNYMTCRYHRMQKHKFDIGCPDTFLWNLYGPTRARKIACRRFTPRTQRNALCDPHISPNAKIQGQHNVSWRFFLEFVPVPHEHEK
jgi:hypothetical protein